jgi:hypothetical protein
MNVYGMLFIVIVVVFVIWCVYKSDIESKKEELEKQEQLKLEETRKVLYKKINTIFPDLNKDIFQKTLDDPYNHYYIGIAQLNLFCLNCEFYKNIFDIFNSKYYFYNNNEINLDIIEDFNNICKLDDRVGELPESSSLSYKNFLIKSFLVKYGQKLVRSGNESYYVNTYTLRQEYCLSIDDKKKYINEKYSLSNE